MAFSLGRVAIFGLLLLGHAIIPASGQSLWTKTGSLNRPRLQTDGIVLNDGRVLVIGSLTCTPGCNSSATAEIYDPATGAWSKTSPLNSPRFNHVAVKLADGRVIVAGGYVSPGVLTASCEVYDPATGLWTPTGSLATPRQFHKGVILANGNVLVAGGLGMNGTGSFLALASAEIYDAGKGQWTSAGSLATARYLHAATRLADGRVLVTGGAAQAVGGQGQQSMASVEIYDPAANAWTLTTPMNLSRNSHTATLLNNGQVLVTGGWNSAGTPDFTAELYNPASGQWKSASRMRAPRASHTATLLPDGSVLAVGGFANWVVTEKYSPVADTWTPMPELNEGRAEHAAMLLDDGSILVAGGVDVNDTYLSSVELLRAPGSRLSVRSEPGESSTPGVW